MSLSTLPGLKLSDKLYLFAAAKAPGGELQVRLVRIVAIGMLLVAATKIVPTMCRYFTLQLT